ncbi:hypothetical protein SAMN04489761_4636 [Tenacibaculum sp. MAR_2009_124]|uniref:phage integrase SAM-like domain-containing protein n=1 Tax=Tenacibaculum sp. MAR_2009_124 TaxID=1250059 RepID=UPI000895509E|nr:phage integrase SAM-like domain-containing protein [Tenacibaculum sp. MAR_2009_124]SED21120.1 hypothetical protein SAMN04489761_4636 [Tenacibaculum sp. MAR_2009_124]
MQGKIYLDTRGSQVRKDGSYPVTCDITGKGKQKPFVLGLKFLKEDWDFRKEEPKRDKTKLLIIRRKKSLLDDLLLKSLDDGAITFDYIKKALKGKLTGSELNGNKESKTTEIDFFEFGFKLAKEKKQVLNEKGVQKEGNGESYITALNQLKKIRPKLNFSEIDYKLLSDFKKSKLTLGLKKNSIAAYLRGLKAIYNEGLKIHKLNFEHHPFVGVFTGVTTRKNRTKKRNISIESIKIFETLNNSLAKGQQLAIDMFLLQFYFGGQDLMDIHYLEKKQVSEDGRIYFTRGKLNEGGYEFDLKIFPKTQRILNKFKSPDKFIFKGRKDYKGYKGHLRRINNNLEKVQERYNAHAKRIEVITGKQYHKLDLLPLGGKITTKVARHTFSTIANRMYVEPDLLRSLMGHERDDVDTIYKDVYPEQERDKHHSNIINTSKIILVKKHVYQYEFLNEERKRSYKYKYFDSEPKPEQLIDGRTDKKYTEPKYLNTIYLIEKSTY